jgi:hypothetical protein
MGRWGLGSGLWRGRDAGTYRETRINRDCCATCMPGQTRRPNPKLRVYSFAFPESGFRKRSGLNTSGSGNTYATPKNKFLMRGGSCNLGMKSE